VGEGMIKQEIYQARSEAIEYKKYIDNMQIVPTSATISITTKSGTAMPTAIIDVACTINIYGTISYTLSAVNTALLGENFIATFKYIYNTVEYLDRLLFDIVKNKVESIINDKDIEDEFSALKELYFPVYGEVSSIGVLNEIIDNKNLNEEKNYYKGGKIKILSGDNQDFVSEISEYNYVSSKLILKRVMPLNVILGDKYVIYKSYETEITRAFEEIKDWLRTQGYRPTLIIDDTELREVHISLSVAKALHPLGKSQRDNYEDYYKKYLYQRDSLRLLYDEDETGLPDDAVESYTQVTLQR
jgi:hypothetical protein